MQKQKVENFINDPNNAPNNRGHLPIKQKSVLQNTVDSLNLQQTFDERLDKKILETFIDSENSMIFAANTFYNNGSHVPPIDIKKGKHTIETRQKSDL